MLQHRRKTLKRSLAGIWKGREIRGKASRSFSVSCTESQDSAGCRYISGKDHPTRFFFVQACNATSEGDLHGDDLDLPLGLQINVGTVKEPKRLEVTREEVVLTYEIGDVTFYLAPVLVCKEPAVTVGLGDAISASALSASFL